MMAGGVKGPKAGAHFLKMAKVIEGASAETVSAAADRAAKLQDERIKRDSGGDNVLSGVGKGTRVGVRVNVNKRKTSPTALVAASGPLQIINNNTAGHVIRPKGVTGRQRRGFIGPTLPGQFRARNIIGPQKAPVLNIPGIGFRRSARHPGTRGKQTWQRATKRAYPAATKIMRGRTWNVVKGAARP